MAALTISHASLAARAPLSASAVDRNCLASYFKNSRRGSKLTVNACFECGDATHRPSQRVAIKTQPFIQHKNHTSTSVRSKLFASLTEPGGTVDAKEADLQAFLDTLKFDQNGLLVASAQHVDTGSILMQAFANREAVGDTLRRGMATFYSRSRQALWTKGETSNNFIKVVSVYIDCDNDSIIYLGEPVGPSCHTGAYTCFYTRVDGERGVSQGGDGQGAEAALTTLFQLEAIIDARGKEEVAEGAKPSWTRKLLDKPELLCSKVREEADELARTWEDKEGKEAAASEMADVLYHCMVLLNKQGVPLTDVCKVLRGRFDMSGIEEKAARSLK